MAKSKIEWTEASWNPVTGCTKISPGCQNCYAERMAYRLQKMGQANYTNGFQVTLHEHVLDYPLRWKKPQIIFVNSMSDLFHKDVSDDFIMRVFDVMQRANWHTFQVLTKRSERLAQIAPKLTWTNNVWIGVSVENEDYQYRIDHLRTVSNASVRFVSFEPLISPMGQVNLDNINWVIVGGESGPHARPIQKEWVDEIKEQCLLQNIPFFFKQWGGVNKKKTGRLLDGKIWDEMPSIAQGISH